MYVIIQICWKTIEWSKFSLIVDQSNTHITSQAISHGPHSVMASERNRKSTDFWKLKPLVYALFTRIHYCFVSIDWIYKRFVIYLAVRDLTNESYIWLKRSTNKSATRLVDLYLQGLSRVNAVSLPGMLYSLPPKAYWVKWTMLQRTVLYTVCFTKYTLPPTPGKAD